MQAALPCGVSSPESNTTDRLAAVFQCPRPIYPERQRTVSWPDLVSAFDGIIPYLDFEGMGRPLPCPDFAHPSEKGAWPIPRCHDQANTRVCTNVADTDHPKKQIPRMLSPSTIISYPYPPLQYHCSTTVSRQPHILTSGPASLAPSTSISSASCLS